MKGKITYKNAIPSSDEEIDELERLTGFTLPSEVKELFMSCAGSRPSFGDKNCLIDIVHSDGWKDTSYLLKIESPKAIIETWEYRDYLEDFQSHFELKDSYVEAKKLFPIIELANNHLYIAIGGIHDGKIYYVDNGDFGIIKIANSLQHMIEKLYKE